MQLSPPIFYVKCAECLLLTIIFWRTSQLSLCEFCSSTKLFIYLFQHVEKQGQFGFELPSVHNKIKEAVL